MVRCVKVDPAAIGAKLDDEDDATAMKLMQYSRVGLATSNAKGRYRDFYKVGQPEGGSVGRCVGD